MRPPGRGLLYVQQDERGFYVYWYGMRISLPDDRGGVVYDHPPFYPYHLPARAKSPPT